MLVVKYGSRGVVSSTTGWKAWFGAVVSVMIAFSTGVFPTDIGALFDSFVPNAGFYIVRISFAACALYLVALLICATYCRWFKTFEAEIVGKKRFDLGENPHLRVWFKGNLKNGYFTCKVTAPKGSVLPDTGRDHVWWPSYDTLQPGKVGLVGILSGSEIHEFSWKGKIHADYPTGTYSAEIGVYESTDSGPKLVKKKELSFFVVSPLSGTFGVSSPFGNVIG